MGSILVLHDDRTASGILTEMLEKLRHKTIEVETVAKAIDRLHNGDVDLVLIDQQADTDTAIKSLAALKSDLRLALIPIVVVASLAKSDEVIEAMRLGALDHLSSPTTLQDLESVINRALAKPKHDLSVRTDQQLAGDFLIGVSPVMRRVEKFIGIAAACGATVLIVGETGTGKDSVARTIHRHSQHKQEPLTVVDCTAIPADYESFQSLSGEGQGTVILDEVGDLNAQMQAMLVRALKETPVETPPGTAAKLRIIATTQYDLINMVKERRFREDLYYRLNVLPIFLPPLKERGSDILALAETFLQQARPDSPKRLSSSAAKLLLDYAWPGNVRELQNLMYHLSVVVRSAIIEQTDLSAITTAQKGLPEDESEPGLDYYSSMSTLEKRLLTKALKEANGSRTEAAKLLGINRQLLYAKLKAHGLMNQLEQ